MRNLKKILALALALVMSMSLMATANAFTDDDSITDTYETAVTVLFGLKVFQGYDDDTFQPKGAITRAEVAAIIYRIVTGDVADTQVGIYADYNKFDDVASTSWYAGYVNFCANAEYIKGYDARTFGPNDPVTGYQALAMILRALGYDKNGEFTGTNWTIQTAAVGEQRGITKNITAGTLGVAATREVVAEILFRAILVPTVNYTPAFGYTIGDTSLGYKTFGLEEITGVVVANEYADLYDTNTLRAGRTELDVGGDSYVIDYTSTLEDIGESRTAYITGSTVLTIEKTGNTVFETGAETDISTDKKFESASALERDDETEYFLNFDGGNSYQASDWRIEYYAEFDVTGLTAAEDAALKAALRANKGDLDATSNPYTYTKTIRPEAEITDLDMDIMKGIFYDGDLETDVAGTTDTVVVGQIYVGTQSKEDISDDPDVSWKTFKDKYIDSAENGVDVEDTENGEWLKIIDNDGDGVADVVLKTEFAMSVIDRVAKDGEVTLAVLDQTDDAVEFKKVNKIESDDIVTEDELAEDDVVIYTFIDGKYYMDLAEMVTETVDKKGINSKTETMTCNGTEYVQSHIGYGTAGVYEHDVTDAHTEYTYDLYLDHFGFVRLFIESDYSAFMLLTDGYYETDRHDEAFRAEYWNADAAEKQEIDVVDGDADDFINVGTNNNIGDRETWRRLIGAGHFYFDEADYDVPFITNVVAYSEGEDGYTLIAANDATRRTDYDVQWLTADEDTDLDTELLHGYTYNQVTDTWSTQNRIQTTTNTQYYLVIRDTDRFGDDFVDTVITWTGYNNVPDEAELGDWAVAYAVTHRGEGRAYDVADVVVFETNDAAAHNTYFVYEYNNYNLEHVWGIGYDENNEIDDQQIDVEDSDHVVYNNGKIEFYEIYDNEYVEHIGDNYADSYIYAGNVNVVYDVADANYFQVIVANVDDGYLRFNPNEVTIYKLDVADGDYVANKVENWDDIRMYDQMILFTDNKENVEYAIWVEEDIHADDYILAADELWGDIINDAADKAPVALSVNESLAHADATVAYTAVRDTNNVITSWTATVTLDADDGYELDADALTAVLANGSRQTVVQGTGDEADNVTITVTGLTDDDILVITGADAAAKAYNITYYVDGTERDALTPATYVYGEGATLPIPSYKGHTFDGWYTNEECTGDKVTAITATDIGDKTLYGRFVEDVVTLTVEYRDVNGNLLPSSYSKDYLRGETETLGVADPAEYSVGGKDMGYVLDGEIPVTMDADKTIVVSYVDDYKLTINVNDDGDSALTWTADKSTYDIDNNEVELVLESSKAFSLNDRYATIDNGNFNSVGSGDVTKTLEKSNGQYFSYTVYGAELTSEGIVINVVVDDVAP